MVDALTRAAQKRALRAKPGAQEVRRIRDRELYELAVLADPEKARARWKTPKRKASLKRRLKEKRTAWTQQRYDQMFLLQNGECYLCGCELEYNGIHTCRDHNHLYHYPRALLCNGCNTIEGLSKDKPGLIPTFDLYRQSWHDAWELQ